jgi:hypothetical protein
MKCRTLSLVATLSPLLLTGCQTFAPAPGAAAVQIVRSAADVASCTAVGNVSADGNNSKSTATAHMRNVTVGFGGNTLFVTERSVGIDVQGIAYRCPK